MNGPSRSKPAILRCVLLLDHSWEKANYGSLITCVFLIKNYEYWNLEKLKKILAKFVKFTLPNFFNKKIQFLFQFLFVRKWWNFFARKTYTHTHTYTEWSTTWNHLIIIEGENCFTSLRRKDLLWDGFDSIDHYSLEKGKTMVVWSKTRNHLKIRTQKRKKNKLCPFSCLRCWITRLDNLYKIVLMIPF